MKKRFWLATALLTTLGIAGVVRSFASSPTPRPVAIMHQSQIAAPSQGITESAPAQEMAQLTSATASFSQADGQLQSGQILQSLQAVSQYSQRISEMAKSNDWQKAEADRLVLQRSVQQLNGQLPSNGSDIRHLTTHLEQLKQAIAAKDQQSVEKTAGQVASLAAQMTQQYSSEMTSTVVK